jgi:hypothetical protein
MARYWDDQDLNDVTPDSLDPITDMPLRYCFSSDESFARWLNEQKALQAEL